MTLIPSEHVQADTQINVPMTHQLELLIRLEAANQRISKAELVRRAIVEYLNSLPQLPALPLAEAETPEVTR